MAISNTSVTTSGANIFLCPGTAGIDEREYAVTCVIFCNYSAQAVTVNVYAIPLGGSVSSATQIIKSLSIPASETFTFDTEKFVLSTGDRLHAVASANSSITATVSSMRVS